MKCPCCGDEVGLENLSLGFGVPDEVFQMPSAQCRERVRANSDLCSIDDTRFFIRGVLEVPIQQMGLNFGWGVWAEVSQIAFDDYLAHYSENGEELPAMAGVLANGLPGNEDGTLGLPLRIQLRASDKRPAFALEPSDNELYREQTEGMPARKWHTLISGMTSAPGAPQESPDRAH